MIWRSPSSDGFRTFQHYPRTGTGFGDTVTMTPTGNVGEYMPCGQLTRRYFVSCLGGAAVAWPLAARAEQTERVRRVAVILPYPENDPQSQARTAIFRAALKERGWVEGRNVQLDLRWDASNLERIQKHAVDLLREKPDVILANSTPVVAALVKEHHTVPIVFVSVSDPVGSGFVANFPRPGGNLTGFTNLDPSMGGKVGGVAQRNCARYEASCINFTPRYLSV